ncbi:MAG: hypothetical protein NTV93_01535 [Verrucomicrobia bacterium]|nr:hypothetical protein [Verrucomicrobiota bacterium]
MSEKNESRFSRVAEGICRYKSGGFYLRCRLAGKPVWHKLKNSDLQSARREARDVIRTGFKVQRKQAARTVEDFSQEELDRYSNAAEKTLKKVEGYHAKVVAHWPDIFAQAICNLPVLETVGSKKHYGRPLLGTNRRGSSPFDSFQFSTLLHAQIDGRGYSHSRKAAEIL